MPVLLRTWTVLIGGYLKNPSVPHSENIVSLSCPPVPKHEQHHHLSSRQSAERRSERSQGGKEQSVHVVVLSFNKALKICAKSSLWVFFFSFWKWNRIPKKKKEWTVLWLKDVWILSVYNSLSDFLQLPSVLRWKLRRISGVKWWTIYWSVSQLNRRNKWGQKVMFVDWKVGLNHSQCVW